MRSAIQTFGESLTSWMEEKGLTPSQLAVYTRETRDATIARLMHDQLDYQRCARYISELAESYPDIDEETLRRLRTAVDVNRYGKEMFLAKNNFLRMIADESQSSDEGYIKAERFCEKILAWSAGMSLKVLCAGLGNAEPHKLLNVISQKRKDIRIFEFFDRERIEELSGLLAETLPIAFNPNYELFEVQGNHGAMMSNAIVVRREDGAHLLIAYDGGEYLMLQVPRGTEIFDFCLNVLLSKHHAPKKINCHFHHNSPERFMVFLSHCLLLEKDKAIYEIKSEIGLEYVPVPILFESFSDWAGQNDEKFLAFIDDLKRIFEKRYENILLKAEPTYLIMTKCGMTEFAKTGRMKDHPFCLRTFMPKERKEIFANLIDLAAKSKMFIPMILSDDALTLNYSFIGYSGECMLVCAAQADYDLDNYKEIVLSSGELAGRFADFVTGILAKNHVLSKKATLEFIQSLNQIVPEDE